MNSIIGENSIGTLLLYLATGKVYSTMLYFTVDLDLLYPKIELNLIQFYFIGLTISIFGLIIVEPLFTKWGWIDSYKELLSKNISENKVAPISINILRTLVALFLLIIISVLLLVILQSLSFSNSGIIVLTIILLSVFFFYSYKKFTSDLLTQNDQSISEDSNS